MSLIEHGDDAPSIELYNHKTLANNQVIITFASHQDQGNFRGWVMAHDKTTLNQTGIFTTHTTAGNRGGGIWASGRAPAVMANGDVVLFTGNGVGAQASDGVNNFGESVLRLRPDPVAGLKLVDFFTPDNWAYLDSVDEDFGGSGPTLVPGTEEIIGGGKEGVLYVIDSANMGKLQAGNPRLKQKFKIVQTTDYWHHIMGGLVTWDRRTAGGSLVFYNWGENDLLRGFRWLGGYFDTTPFSTSRMAIAGHPGGILAVSSNGPNLGSGIVWSLASDAGNAVHSTLHGVMRAFDASDLTRELWNSNMHPADNLGNFAKFVPPVVANGRVYAANHSGGVSVYGLLPRPRNQPAALSDYVKIVSRLDPTKVIEVAGAALNEGAGIQLATDRGLRRQRWQRLYDAQGNMSLVSPLNGKTLDALAANVVAGTQVLNRAPTNADTQKWVIQPTQLPYGVLVSKANGMTLDVPASQTADGTPIQMYARHGDNNQQWSAVSTPNAGLPDCNTSQLKLQTRNGGRHAGGAWAGVVNDTRVVVNVPDATPNQTWRLVSEPGGRFKFVGQLSGRVLGVQGGAAVDGSQVTLWDDIGATWQRWLIKPTTSGHVSLESVSAPGKVIDIPGNSPGRQYLQIYGGNRSTAQDWLLKDAWGVSCIY